MLGAVELGQQKTNVFAAYRSAMALGKAKAINRIGRYAELFGYNGWGADAFTFYLAAQQFSESSPAGVRLRRAAAHVEDMTRVDGNLPRDIQGDARFLAQELAALKAEGTSSFRASGDGRLRRAIGEAIATSAQRAGDRDQQERYELAFQ